MNLCLLDSASQYPIMDPAWESPEGVPIDVVIFGGRRPPGLRVWNHGVFVGTAMMSESTAADEHAGM